MKKTDVVRVWGRVLRGRRPFLSVEITKECPLRCPGCYAYTAGHLGGGSGLRELADYSGGTLVEAVVALVKRERPIHVSIVGGEPLVRYRELGEILPRLDRMGIETQLVTSAVRPIPPEWSAIASLHLVVSIDGLREDHDVRRAPATYPRILRHIVGHRVIVHCTVTRPMTRRPEYIRDFCAFWSERKEVRRIWFSLYTPQAGEISGERLGAEDRQRVLPRLEEAAGQFPKVHLPREMLRGLREPPRSPAECVFARLTTCVTADLKTRVEPCQLGGAPVCAECGCIASAGMHGVGGVKLAGLVSIGSILNPSIRLGARMRGASAAAD